MVFFLLSLSQDRIHLAQGLNEIQSITNRLALVITFVRLYTHSALYAVATLFDTHLILYISVMFE